MTHYSWDQRLETGIASFDQNHRRIMDYANELFDAVKSRDRATVGRLLDLLLEYSVSVLSYENTLLEQINYPYADEHKAVHDNFTMKIMTYRERHLQGEDVSRQLLSDLKIWITNHIYRDDADYVPYLQSRYPSSWLRKMLTKMCA